jgi:opacity protein-like surface antigen
MPDLLVGYTRLKDDNIDLSGIHYGGQAGVIVGVVENIEVEAGYRFLMERGNNHGIDAEYSKTWYAGINILF